MHDSENGTHSATAAETLVLTTNNLVYSEPSTYFDVININHHHHHHHHNHHHLSHIHHQSHQYHDNPYTHDIPSNVDQSNSNDLSLFQNIQNTLPENGHSLQQQQPKHQLTQPPHHQHDHSEQLLNQTYSQSSYQLENITSLVEDQTQQPRQTSSETHFVDDIMIDSTNHQDSTTDHDGTKANKQPHMTPPTTLDTTSNILELNEKSSIVETLPANICNTTTTTTDLNVTSNLGNISTSTQLSPPHDQENQLYPIDVEPAKIEIDCPVTTYSHGTGEDDDDQLVDDDDEEEEEEEDDDDGDDEEEEDDDDDDDDDDEDDDEEEEDNDEDASEDDSEDIVDPGQHCQLIQQANDDANENLIERDDQRGAVNDILDGERMLEVTRKLVRNTERDPDRDLRKQVLLKTAIKKLPHFMEYNRYSDSLDRSLHSNMSPQAYYEHHDSQQKFYHSVQPNAIQMSTTSLRMLDLNDDHDPELGTIEQEHSDPNLGYSNRTSLDQHDYVSQHQYDRYHQRAHDLNHFETGGPMISRHNSLDNLYQPINGSDINEDMKDERIPIAFQIACEIYDFTCAPDDNERKLLDNLTNGYYTRPTKEPKTSGTDDGCGEDGTETRDQDGSDTSSSSQSSSSDESANSIVSQSTESDETNGTSLLEASLNSSSDFYHSSLDSGVALFSPRSNKRSSSSIGLDDEMEIDHLTELSTRSPNIGSNNQYKKLRKREIID